MVATVLRPGVYAGASVRVVDWLRDDLPPAAVMIDRTIEYELYTTHDPDLVHNDEMLVWGNGGGDRGYNFFDAY